MRKLKNCSIKSLMETFSIPKNDALNLRSIANMIPEELRPKTRQAFYRQGAPAYPYTVCPKVLAHVLTCFNPPLCIEIKMLCFNEILDGHGVENIEGQENTFPDRNPHSIDYVNMGDPYIATVLYYDGAIRVGCWGDIVERGGKRYA